MLVQNRLGIVLVVRKPGWLLVEPTQTQLAHGPGSLTSQMETDTTNSTA